MSFIRKCNLDTYKNLPIHDSNCNFRFFYRVHTRLHMDPFIEALSSLEPPNPTQSGSLAGLIFFE